ncbi:MAG: alpha/beta fold hydrolase [Planctomycetota bacterium]
MTGSGTPVWFPNGAGQRLSGVVHGEPHPYAVLACHGMLSDKGSAKIGQLMAHLDAVRMPAMRFDFAGRGESDGYLLDLSITGQMQDLRAALDDLERRGAERIGVFGSSLGGTVALLTAATDSRIQTVATLGAVAFPNRIEETWPEAASEWRSSGQLQTEAGPIGEGFLLDALRHDAASAAASVQVPTLIVHGEKDEVVPLRDAQALHAAIPGAELHVLPEADHRVTDPLQQQTVMRDIGKFLVASLRS